MKPSSRFASRWGSILHISRFIAYTSYLIPYLILSALPFLFFWRLFAPNPLDRMWLPAGDLTLQYFPLRVFAAREMASGHWPLWNPHMYAGQPGLADAQMAVLYPINLLTVLMLALLGKPFTFGVFQLQIVLHYALTAMFTYAFAFRLTQRRAAAFIAALTFTFGGYLISYPAQQPTILASATWLPLILLLLDKAAEPMMRLQRLWWLACAGAAMAMSILAGHPQTYLYVLYTSIAYGLYVMRDMPSITRVTGCGVFVAFAAGISAAQLLPTLEFTRYSTRAQLGYNFTSGGFALHELVTLLIPGYFGGSPLYVGFMALWLAFYAFIAPQRNLQDRALSVKDPIHPARRTLHVSRSPYFWLFLALIALFLSLGDGSFLYSLFYLLAPGFAQVRNQERAALLWSFALALLAAMGAARLSGVFPRPMRIRMAQGEKFWGWLLLALIILIAVAYLLALVNEGAQVNLFPGVLRQLVPAFFYGLAGWALWRLRFRSTVLRRWLMSALVMLIALNLFSVNGVYNFQKPTPPTYFPETPLTRALLAEIQANPLARVASEGLLPGEHNAGADYGFADINGNDPLHLQAWEQFDKEVNELRKFQLLGVQYVVTKREITHGAFTRLAAEGDAKLYRYNDAMPRAWLVHAAQVVSDAQVFAMLNDPAFNHQTSVLLSSTPPIALSVPAQPTDGVAIEMFRAGHWVAQTASATPGLLVVSEVFYPGWKAWVDGVATPMLPANGLLMALPVPSGAHKIELTFDPDGWKIGGIISIISIISWAAIVVVWWRRR